MCIRGSKNANYLSYESIDNPVILSSLRGKDVVVTGGEPTLHRQFEQIVFLLSQYSRTVTVCTNGILNYYVPSIFENGNVKIQISLDGDVTTHDSIRGVGTFDRIWHTIQLLESDEIHYQIATVVSHRNMGKIHSLRNQLSTLTCLDFWSCSYEMPFGFGSKNDIMSADEWNSFVDSILRGSSIRIKIKKIFAFELFEKYKNRLDELYQNHHCSNCGSGNNKLYIYPDLNVYPCTCLTDFPLGNLSTESLNKILEKPITEQFANYQLAETSLCNACEYKRYCNGGCIGMSYHFFHKLGMGDIRCPKLK